MSRRLVISVGSALVIAVILYVAWPRSVRPVAPSVPPQNFQMGGTVWFQPGDPKALIPPDAPSISIVGPTSHQVVKASDKPKFLARIVPPSPKSIPCFVIFSVMYLESTTQLGTIIGEPLRRDVDGSFVVSATFPKTLPPGRYRVMAETQVIHMIGLAQEDPRAVTKPFYFDSPIVEFEVRR